MVLSKSLAEVAQNVIKHVRLALLTPEELKQVELDNDKDKMIPVSLNLIVPILVALSLGQVCQFKPFHPPPPPAFVI